MTEAEWLSSADPERMYSVVENNAFKLTWPAAEGASRKVAFFGAACCRLVWPLISANPHLVRAVEELETRFDAPKSEEELDEIWLEVKDLYRHPATDTALEMMSAAQLVEYTDDPLGVIRILLRTLKDWGEIDGRAGQIAAVMRDIVGNPFRPAVFKTTWRTETVVALAYGIYTERAFDRLPIMADALEEAGCDDVDILDHCRAPGLHVHGCWVVELALGRL